MLKRKHNISANIVLIITVSGLSGCSTLSQVGKSARNLTTFGGNSVTEVDNDLIIPPSLKLPAEAKPKQTASSIPARQVATKQPQPKKAAYSPDGNYYIIVGTYSDQLDALDTFTRISSIGLKGATMESRRTKAGSLLHMVRLGPYSNQKDIDEAKDSLTNSGMSQFKIVKN